MNINVRSILAGTLKRGRLALNRHGYDFHPIDCRCLIDQEALLGGREEMVIFDVGANGGQTAVAFRTAFPKSHIHCFEPQADLCKSMERHFTNDEKILVHCCAVGSNEGTAEFYLNTKRDTSSLLPSDHEHLSSSYQAILKVEECREVKVITLDSFAEANRIEHIDLMKLDIQGGELDAITGAKDVFSQGKVDVLYTEAYFVPMYTNQPLFGDLACQLAKWDYKLHLIYNQILNGISGRPLWADAIFVSPKMQAASRQRLQDSWIT